MRATKPIEVYKVLYINKDGSCCFTPFRSIPLIPTCGLIIQRASLSGYNGYCCEGIHAFTNYGDAINLYKQRVGLLENSLRNFEYRVLICHAVIPHNAYYFLGTKGDIASDMLITILPK